MSKFDPPNPYDRFLDLQKQGFMRMANKTIKPKKVKASPVMVACDYCMDWHYKNKHTANKEQRDANIKERKAKDKEFRPTQREIQSQ